MDYPYTSFYDNDLDTQIRLHVSSIDSTLESDIVAYIKNRMTETPGHGSLGANRFEITITTA